MSLPGRLLLKRLLTVTPSPLADLFHLPSPISVLSPITGALGLGLVLRTGDAFLAVVMLVTTLSTLVVAPLFGMRFFLSLTCVLSLSILRALLLFLMVLSQ